MAAVISLGHGMWQEQPRPSLPIQSWLWCTATMEMRGQVRLPEMCPTKGPGEGVVPLGHRTADNAHWVDSSGRPQPFTS